MGGRGELLASLLASEPGETAADERPARRASRSVYPSTRRRSTRLACLVLAYSGPDHGRARYYERAGRAGKYPR